jgi:hypothetical protein
MSDDMKAVKVRVTREKLATGKPRHCQSCPVALAINEHLKPGFHAFVASWDFIIDGPASEGILYESHLPCCVTARIVRFDNGRGGRPFKFTLALPTRFLKDTLDAHP